MKEPVMLVQRGNIPFANMTRTKEKAFVYALKLKRNEPHGLQIPYNLAGDGLF